LRTCGKTRREEVILEREQRVERIGARRLELRYRRLMHHGFVRSLF
jgi:hypothetical protein